MKFRQCRGLNKGDDSDENSQDEDREFHDGGDNN